MLFLRIAFLLVFSLESFSVASDTIESMAIREEIDALEKQKVLLQQTIKYAQEQLPIARQTLKDVETYGSKMQEVITNNNYKAMMSGGLNIVLEVAGAGNKGKLVDLGAWLVGKGIGLGMENSKTLAGEAYYKKKIEGISSTQRNLTGELDKLYKISHSSDEAMKSYYNKYGKYSDQFELGDIGVFTQRMRLIVEQSTASALSLNALIDTLHRMLTEAETDLRNTERRISELRKQLEELSKKNKEENKKEQEKAIELSDGDKNAAIIQPPSKTSIAIPGEPSGCRSTYHTEQEANAIVKTLQNIQNTAISAQNELNELIDERFNQQKDYFESIQAKLGEIQKTFDEEGKAFAYSLEGQALEKIKQGQYPTGAPFKKFIEHTNDAHKNYIDRMYKRIDAKKSLSETIIEGIPTHHDAKIAQEIANISALKGNYHHISSVCLRNERYLNLSHEKAPSDGIVTEIKHLKRILLIEVEQETKNLEEMKKWHAARMPEIERLFADRRAQMREEISAYESSLEKKVSHEQQLIGLIYELKAAESKAFDTSGDLQENLCKTLAMIKTRAENAKLGKISTLQKKIQFMIGLNKIYGVNSLPVDAYIEFEQDPNKIAQKYSEHDRNYIEAMQSYLDGGSNAQFIAESLDANAFHMLASQFPNSIFYKLYREQVRVANEIKHRIKNANVEIENAISSERVQADRLEAFIQMHKNIQKEFKDHFGCIPKDTPLITGLAEEIETMKERIDKVKSKPLFTNATGTIKNAQVLLEKIKSFSVDIDNGESYRTTYDVYKKEYQSYVEFAQLTSLYPTDKQALNQILLDIDTYFSGHDDFIKQHTSIGEQQKIEDLYKRFQQEYSNKNLSALMSLLSDEWMSSGDGTTLMDLEDTLSNSFSIFNEVSCEIGSLYISSSGNNLYTANYVITIQGINYENDIKHIEKSTVTEEITIIDGKPKISKTLSGKYWTIR